MTDLIFLLIGGIGLFLLGMVLLTEGLKGFAGDALSRALARFTGTPFKAFASGAVVTAMVQSLEQESARLADFRKRHRPEVLRNTAVGSEDPSAALDQLDAMRWFDRLGYHTWRICLHLDPDVVTPLELDKEY